MRWAVGVSVAMLLMVGATIVDPGETSIYRGSRAKAAELTEHPSPSMVRTLAKEYVKRSLKAPSTAEFPHRQKVRYKKKSRIYNIRGSVDAQNSFGAMLRQDYTILLHVSCGDSSNPRCYDPVHFVLGDEVVVEREISSTDKQKEDFSEKYSNNMSRKEYLKNLQKEILEQKRYPQFARDKNMEGEAKISFTINDDGSLYSVNVVDSSGYNVLDRASLEMVKAASPFPPLPDHMSRDRFRLVLPVGYALN